MRVAQADHFCNQRPSPLQVYFGPPSRECLSCQNRIVLFIPNAPTYGVALLDDWSVL